MDWYSCYWLGLVELVAGIQYTDLAPPSHPPQSSGLCLTEGCRPSVDLLITGITGGAHWAPPRTWAGKPSYYAIGKFRFKSTPWHFSRPFMCFGAWNIKCRKHAKKNTCPVFPPKPCCFTHPWELVPWQGIMELSSHPSGLARARMCHWNADMYLPAAPGWRRFCFFFFAQIFPFLCLFFFFDPLSFFPPFIRLFCFLVSFFLFPFVLFKFNVFTSFSMK